MGLEHPSPIQLRRLHAGELSGDQAERTFEHVSGCPSCGKRLDGFKSEQAELERALPFEKFARGVAEARAKQKAAPQRVWGLATAAALVTLVGVGPQLRFLQIESNRTKGGAQIELRIGGAWQRQRVAPADGVEVLSPSERVRLGYVPGEEKFLASVSVDEQGEVTALYPERGTSLPVRSGPRTEYLPGSLRFTGNGAERIIVVMTKTPLAVDAVREAARRAYTQAEGDVRRMGQLDLPGEQFHRVLLKQVAIP